MFLPVRDVLEQDWPEHDDEVRRLNLQYRNRLEFAIGRTCSVDWTVTKGSRRATAVSTTWLPVGETPQTRARVGRGRAAVDGRPVEVDRRRAARRLEPLVTGYGDVARRAGGSATQLPAHLRETAELVLWEARQAHARLVAGLEHRRDRSGGAAVLPVHEPGDARPAHRVAGRCRCGHPIASVTIDQAQAKVAERGRRGGVVAPVPAGVHPDAARSA